jgi:hypothetical protein
MPTGGRQKMTDGLRKQFRCPRPGADISICAEAHPTRRRNVVTFQQTYWAVAAGARPRAGANARKRREHVRNNGAEAV